MMLVVVYIDHDEWYPVYEISDDPHWKTEAYLANNDRERRLIPEDVRVRVRKAFEEFSAVQDILQKLEDAPAYNPDTESA